MACQHDPKFVRYNLVGVAYCSACRQRDARQITQTAQDGWGSQTGNFLMIPNTDQDQRERNKR